MTPLLHAQAYLYLNSRADGRPRGISDWPRISRLAGAPGGGRATYAHDNVLLECGAEMAGLRHWMVQTCNRRYFRPEVRLAVAERARNHAVSLEMSDVLLVSFRLPELNRSSKGPAFLSVALKAARMTMRAIAVNPDPKSWGYSGPSSALPWSTSKFKLSIKGLEKECAATTGIDALQFGLGVMAVPEIEPFQPTGAISWTNLRLTLPQNHQAAFAQWSDSMVKGNASEKPGTLEYYGAHGAKPIFRLGFDAYLTSLSVRGSEARVEVALESVKADL